MTRSRMMEKLACIWLVIKYTLIINAAFFGLGFIVWLAVKWLP